MKTTATEVNGITFNRIDNNFYGNPRYVVHFLTISRDYNRAVKLANKIGGRKYTAKWYGGGIVFQSYSLPELAKSIKQVSEIN